MFSNSCQRGILREVGLTLFKWFPSSNAAFIAQSAVNWSKEFVGVPSLENLLELLPKCHLLEVMTKMIVEILQAKKRLLYQALAMKPMPLSMAML